MVFRYLFCQKKEHIVYFLTIAIKRSKHKDTHWSVVAKKKTPKDKALQYFDNIYRSFYGSEWPSIRLALLSPSKYCALVNNLADTDETLSYLKEHGAVNIQDVFEVELNKAVGSDSEHVSQTPRKKSPKNSAIEDHLIKKSNYVVKHVETDKVGEPSPAYEHGQQSLAAELINPEMEYDRMVKPNTLGDMVTTTALHEFVPATELKGMEDWVPESEHFRHFSFEDKLPFRKIKEDILSYPEHWKIFSFIRGDISRFPSPRRGKAGVFNYYLLDCASILPVLALNISFGDRILDMCAAPGGKTLLMLQTLYPEFVVSNDNHKSRIERINGVLDDHIFSLKSWKNNVRVTKRDGRYIDEQNIYNKVLVDVPCTTDRHSVLDNDNNIFSPNRVKERIRIPELQAALLSNALKIVRPGGTVVYSTCSLSPIQNDGVVHMALKTIWEETDIEVEIRDLSPALQITKNVFKFANKKHLRYGHVVLPFLPNNFGPSYFCKLVRKK